MKTLRILACLACVGLLSSSAQAALQFELTFLEQWFTVDTTGPGVAGPDNASRDTHTDLWSASLTGVSPYAAGVNIDSFTITLEPAVYFDVSAGGSGFDAAFPFANTGGSASLASTAGGTEGGGTLTLNFNAGGFGVGNTQNFSIDVDNSNAVVRGSNGGGNNSDMKGATVTVNYTDNGIQRQTVLTFAAGGPGTASDSASAKGEILATPEPVSVVVWSALGLMGCAAARRRRR